MQDDISERKVLVLPHKCDGACAESGARSCARSPRTETCRNQLFRALGRGEAARDGKLFWGDMKRYARAGPRVGGSTTYERLPFG